MRKTLKCYKCKNFQIRYHDKKFPYGCKALGFRSADKNWYWLILPCPYYVENPNRKKESNSKNENNHNDNNLNYLI